MYPIVEVQDLNPEVVRMVVEAPAIARKHQPGQFIILRIDETGERIPLTVNEVDVEAGTVTVVFQKVGATTMQLAALHPGDVPQQRRAVRRHVEGVAHMGHGCLQGQAVLHRLIEQPGGSYARQAPPGGPHAGQLLQQVVIDKLLQMQYLYHLNP